MQLRLSNSTSHLDGNEGSRETLTACRVDSTGRGRVVICIVLPTRLEMMNMSIPSCRLLVQALLMHNFCCNATPATFVVYVVAFEHHVGSSHLLGYETCAAGSSPSFEHLLKAGLLRSPPVPKNPISSFSYRHKLRAYTSRLSGYHLPQCFQVPIGLPVVPFSPRCPFSRGKESGLATW